MIACALWAALLLGCANSGGGATNPIGGTAPPSGTATASRALHGAGTAFPRGVRPGAGTDPRKFTSGKGNVTTARSALSTGNNPWVERDGLTSDQLYNELWKWNDAGYQLTYIDGYFIGSQDFYTAIFQQGGNPGWWVDWGMSEADYVNMLNYFAGSDWWPVAVSGYTLNGVDYYAAIWAASSVPTLEIHAKNAYDFQAAWNSNQSNGYRFVSISGYGNGAEEYAAILAQTDGPAQVLGPLGQTYGDFQSFFANQVNQNSYHLTQVDAYPVPGDVHYVSVFEQGPGAPWLAVPNQTSDAYHKTLQDLRYQGYQPVVVSGYSPDGFSPQYIGLWQNYAMSESDLAHIDQVVTGFIQGSGAPAISLAVAKNGRLVFAKAYGNADTETGTAATTASIFRVASISKTITSTAVLTLADQGYLSIDDYVFGPNSVFDNTYPYPNPGCRGTGVPCVEDITIKDLLSMVAGGWCSDTGSWDPPLSSPWDACNDTCQIGQCEDGIIRATLANQPLDKVTETTYGYSNFNYIILAQIIQAVTHQPYVDWVRQNILVPLGAADMQIGNNSQAEKVPNEVSYYPAGTGTSCHNGGPYQFNLHVMEGNGGWVASPIDLLRFMTHVDGLASPPDVLKAATHSEMITNQAWVLSNGQTDGGYGMGWYLGQNGGDINSDPSCSANLGEPACVQFGNGELMPGTNTEMGSTRGGTSWAVLANLDVSQVKKDPQCQDTPSMRCARYSLYDDIVKPVLNNVSAWPSGDLFKEPQGETTNDLTGDGRSDIALTGYAPWQGIPLAILNLNYTSTFEYASLPDFAGWAAMSNVTSLSGDFNGDGVSDIALTGNSTWWTLPVAYSNGDGTYFDTNNDQGYFAYLASLPGVHPVAGDFDGDGKADVALYNVDGAGNLYVAYSHGDGSFGERYSYPAYPSLVNIGAQAGCLLPVAGDFNGDGRADIALLGGCPALSTIPMLFSNGDGSVDVTNFSPYGGTFQQWAGEGYAVPGDFNGDGLSDIALTGGRLTTTIPVAFSNGNGTFIVTNNSVPTFGSLAQQAGAKVVAGDFNGDGVSDIALTGGPWSYIPVAFGSSSGLFSVANTDSPDFASVALTPGARPVNPE